MINSTATLRCGNAESSFPSETVYSGLDHQNSDILHVLPKVLLVVAQQLISYLSLRACVGLQCSHARIPLLGSGFLESFRRINRSRYALAQCGQALLFLLVALVIHLSPSVTFAQNLQLMDLEDTSAKERTPVTVAKTELDSSLVLVTNSAQSHSTGVAWMALIEDSMRFLAVEHAFRCITEQGTRDRIVNEPFFAGYRDSVGSLHGWSDGDPFYVNYIGHPMQGAIAGYIWQHNDRGYRDVEFGKNRRYWKSKLRSLAFSYVYSVQFEIGPLSEASIGHIQQEYPQVGFVDQVITPTIGTGWTIAEDYLDRELIQRAETKLHNSWLRLLLRSGLNPSRSFANVMSGNVPWHRDDRPGVFRRHETLSMRPQPETRTTTNSEIRGNAPFEFAVTADYRAFLDSSLPSGCSGASGTAAFRIDAHWQILGEVAGCKVNGLDYPRSGDLLDYSIGSRWTGTVDSKWKPYMHLLIGGTHVTQELVNDAAKAELQVIYKSKKKAPPHDLYSMIWEENSVAIKAGAGIGYNINSALSVRIIDVNYGRNWLSPINGVDYRNSLQWTSGLVLRMGTW
ncbi:MAG: hypothetical protein ROO76_13045 [Terriglobia bacterium]|nr:hypothetical protein [Terriglobia bacterium]